MTQLLGESTYWRGEAADAFREALDGDLPRQLRNAHRSVSKAAAKLRGWHDDLVGYQATARRYDTRAKLDAAALMRAESHHERARTTNVPEPELKAAGDAVTRAREALESVRRLARELEETHRVEAGRVAKSLNEATERLAPGEPGVLDRVLKWVDEDLGDFLSDVSAVVGFAAMVIGPLFPPVGLALLFVATGASFGALALHLRDPRVHKSLKDGLTKGEFDADFWDCTVTLTGDALGSVPGVAAVAHGAKSASAASHALGALGDSGGIASAARTGSSAFTSGATIAMDGLRQVENPLAGWALRSTPDAVQETVKYTLTGTGAITATSHLPVFGENETVDNTATAVDGVRAVVDDGPSAAAKAAHAWTIIAR
ncbi:hypothetical protein [Streptomyces sp. NBC_00829]|uniref:hypothetical protein n=1 Tax=Streptomyces sp. NBC_00829 TaxID=2903679 RepID=UPI003864EE94|nr:hypothetical protein OG293_04520 [Streptomyces sp. NBC_00829]